MVIHITPEIEAGIRQRVESGEYANESEVLREALRMLNVRERRVQEIRASIEEGLAELERGEGIELTPEVMEEISREADELIRLGVLPKPDVCP
jgi:antitoxin ParD1/3/4